MTNHEARQKIDGKPRMKIGAVARLTGIGVHTLRKWESRYQAVNPARTPGGGRLYSYEDVKRLALIKKLSEAGRPLAEVASAGLEELESAEIIAQEQPPRLQRAAAPVDTTQVVRIAVVGNILPIRFANNSSLSVALQVVATAASIDQLITELSGKKVDLLVYEAPAVDDGTGALANQAMKVSGAKGAILVYGFGSRKNLDALRRKEIVMIRGPLDFQEIERMALALMSDLSADKLFLNIPRPQGGPKVPVPRFSLQEIARVASLASKVGCDCALHIGSLISSLEAFEQYSEGCEDTDPAEVELHRYLGETAARARVAFEEAFARLAEEEGLELKVL